MNLFYRIALCLSFVFTIFFGNATSLKNTPKDSTSKIVDRSTALIMLEDGKTKWGEGKVRDALIKFRQASVKDPYSWRAPYWISKCHYRMDNYGYALKYGKLALELGKEDVNDELYYVLALAYHRNGVLDSAIVHYEAAIERLSKMRVKELRIQQNVDQCKYAQTLMASEPSFERKRI